MSHPARPVVIVLCGDPGGASAMAPVLERLRDGPLRAKALAYKEARSLWRSRGIDFEELAEETSEADAARMLTSSEAAALVVGTSGNSANLEKVFTTAARRTGTPSLALLDYWSHYVDRFSDADGKLADVPDVIAVMDDSSRAEMIEVGFDPARLVVTGQPAFDGLPALRAGFTDARRRAVRGDLGAGRGARLVAFVSQPMAAIFGSTPASKRYLGYTEEQVLAALLGAIQKNAQRSAPVVLAVIPHPREDPRALEGLSSAHLDVIVSRDHTAHDVLMSADLVVGMNSILLMEACYLGCPTLSIQPDLRQADSLPTNRMGISRAVYDAAEVEGAVADLLLNASSRSELERRMADFSVDGRAAERVVALIQRLCDGAAIRAPQIA